MNFDFSKKYNRNTLGGLLIHTLAAFGIIFLLAVVYFFVYLPGATNHGESITVPNVEGMSIEKVSNFLKEHDLRFEVSDSSYSSEYPPLTVLKQVPAAGSKVKENRKIYISINRLKPPTVPMPELIDGSLINAEAVLKGSELKRGKIIFVPGPFLNVVQEMRVDGQKVPPHTRISKGTVVDLVVMDGGSTTLSTPNLIGETFEDAKVLVLGSNLNLGATQIMGDTTGKNPVILKQKPEAGENIRIGDVVDVWIGPKGSTTPEEDFSEPIDGGEDIEN